MNDETLLIGIKELVRILEETKNKRMALESVFDRLENWHKKNSQIKTDVSFVNMVLHTAIDRWIVEMVIDYSDYNEEGIPIGLAIWYVQIPTDRKRKYLHALSKEQQALLKTLYSSQTSTKIGTLTFQDAISKMEEFGIRVDELPRIDGMTAHYFAPSDDTRIKWVYLIPEFEKDENHQREINQMVKRSMDIDDRIIDWDE